MLTFMGEFYSTDNQFVLSKEHLSSKEGEGLNFSLMSSMCECSVENPTVTSWEWLLHEFGLCALFLKSFPALKQAFGHPKCF